MRTPGRTYTSEKLRVTEPAEAQKRIDEYRRSLTTKCERCGQLGAFHCDGCQATLCPERTECHVLHQKASRNGPPSTPELAGKRPRGWGRS